MALKMKFRLLGSVQVSGFEFTKMKFHLLGSVQVSGFEFTKMKQENKTCFFDSA